MQTSSKPMTTQTADQPGSTTPKPNTAPVITLRFANRLHDPLRLMQEEPPARQCRIVLWAASILLLAMFAWSAIGKLDIVATTQGKLVPQTLVKIVQPAEAGIVSAILVNEGDSVHAGQVLARLDTTIAGADRASVAAELAMQQMQLRRIEAELFERPMTMQAGDDAQRFTQVQSQYHAHRKAYIDGMEQERSLLDKAGQERKSAMEILAKLEQTLPAYQKTAEAYARLEKDGFIGAIAAAEKRRESTEKEKDLDAQKATISALSASIDAQQKKISQLQSLYKSDLQKELADVRARIEQLLPNLDKTNYRMGLTELHAPQGGTIKDLATTTVGAVVQPGTVLMTLVPKEEPLFADVVIRNEDAGFVRAGQAAQVKLAAYPFQKYGMLSGEVIHVSVDATESGQGGHALRASGGDAANGEMPDASAYKIRVKLNAQNLTGPQGENLMLAPGMQVVAEIHQGRRTVLEYLLSPVRKVVSEAGRER